MSSPQHPGPPDVSRPEDGQRAAKRPGRHAGQTVVVIGGIVLAFFAWGLDLNRRNAASRQAASASARLQVDLNRASVEELMLLPGIGPALARRIVEHRRSQGPFATLEALDEVHGIGAAKLDGAAPYLTVAPAARDSVNGESTDGESTEEVVE